MRSRRIRLTAVLLLCLSIWLLPAQALTSKTYKFKEGVILQIGASADGLRLDNVSFRVPKAKEGRLFRTSGSVKAQVAISNEGAESRRVGIAIALFDSEGNLVGVASGGSRWLPVKPERQNTYVLVFDDVNELAHQAATFQISIETR